MFKIAIIGADGINDFNFCLNKTIKIIKNKASEKEGIMLLSTGEEFVKKFSELFSIDFQVLFTDFKKYGKDALKMRNKELLNLSDAIIIFNDNKKDTNFLFEMTKKTSLPYRFITK